MCIKKNCYAVDRGNMFICVLFIPSCKLPTFFLINDSIPYNAASYITFNRLSEPMAFLRHTLSVLNIKESYKSSYSLHIH